MSLYKSIILTNFTIAVFIGTILIFTSCSLLMPRPQEPTKRPYNVQQVAFKGGAEGVTLVGEMTMPKTNGPFPAVVLLAGSGPQNRNEDVAGHKVFLVLSDYLTRRGYAVLRYDKRGIGDSSGDYQTATMDDFANDAGVALRWLKAQSNIDTARVGFLGHSSGGYVAPLAAQEDGAAFLILLAAPARPLSEEMKYQHTVIPKAMGKSKKYCARNLAGVHELIRISKTAETADQFRQQLDAACATYQKDLGLKADHAEKILELVPAVWWMWAMRHDPLPALNAYPGPVLALFGGKDLQVSAEANASVMQKVLSHEASKTIVFPDLNHLFQPAETGSPEEYAWIETTFDEGAMAVIGDWLDSLSSRKRQVSMTTLSIDTTKP